MKSLLYIVAIFALFYFVTHFIGIVGSIIVALLIVAAILWSKRYNIKINLAYQAYFVRGDEEKANEIYKSVYKSGMMSPSAKVTYAAFCLYTERFKKCRLLLEEVINSSRSAEADRANAQHYLAILEWKEGNLDEAVSLMEIVHKEYPSSGTYGSLGAFYIEKAKRDDCFEDYLEFMLEAYDYNDSDKTISDNLGELYLRTKEYEKASEVYEKLLVANQTSPVPYFNYALVLKELGKKDEAKETLEKALTKDFTRSLTVSREDVEAELAKLN